MSLEYLKNCSSATTTDHKGNNMNELPPITKKYWAFGFGYPLKCNYRTFCSYWWKHWFTPRVYINFVKFKYQRITRGFADCDTWNFNNYVSDVMYHALVHFKATNHGYPNGMTEEEWSGILDKMIEGFHAKILLLDDEYADHCWIKTESDTVGKFNKKLYAAWQKPLLAKWKEGSTLFIKHFDSLWD